MKWLDTLQNKLEKEQYTLQFSTDQKRNRHFLEIEGQGEKMLVGIILQKGISHFVFQEEKNDDQDFVWGLFGRSYSAKDETSYSLFLQQVIKEAVNDYTRENRHAMIKIRGRKVKKLDTWEEFNEGEKEIIACFKSDWNHQHQQITQQFSDLREKNNTLFYRRTAKNDIPIHFFYWEGYQGEIEVEWQDQTFFLVEKNLKIKVKIDTEESVKQACNQVLDGAYKKMRLRNITDPPSWHFIRYLQRNDLYVKGMFEAITTIMNPREVEEKSAVSFQEGSFVEQKQIQDVYIYEIFGYYLITEDQGPIYARRTKEEMKKKVYELASKQLKEEIHLL